MLELSYNWCVLSNTHSNPWQISESTSFYSIYHDKLASSKWLCLFRDLQSETLQFLLAHDEKTPVICL